MDDNQLSITNEEFASAILEARPERQSIGDFFNLITTPGPKEKHKDWQRVCEHIKMMKNIPTIDRRWRKTAHRIFLENLVAIEKIIWSRIMNTSLEDSNFEDVFQLVNTTIDQCHDKLRERRNHRQ